jgi:hypothetical protein
MPERQRPTPKPISNHEFARILQAETLAKLERDAQAAGPESERLASALYASNQALGDQAVKDYEKRIPHGAAAHHHFLQSEIEEMRALLLASQFASELQDCVPSKLPLCFMATGDPNAAALPAPDGLPVVKIELALQGWLVFINRMLFRCAEANTDRRARKIEFLKAIRSWTEGAFGISLPKDIDHILDLFISTCAEPFGVITSVQMTDWQLLWVLAHEMAHVALGHVSTATTRAAKAHGCKEPLDWYVRSHEQEFAADRRATEYFLAVFGNCGVDGNTDAVVLANPGMVVAPLMVLMYFTYVEMLVWQPGQTQICDHPRSKERVEALIGAFGDRLLASPEAVVVFALAQEMILKASYEVFDKLGIPRPGKLPPDIEFNWSLGKRLD